MRRGAAHRFKMFNNAGLPFAPAAAIFMPKAVFIKKNQKKAKGSPPEKIGKGSLLMKLYEAIYNRKSVRNFSRKPVPPELLGKIKNCAGHLKRLDESVRFQVDILDMTKGNLRLMGPFRVKSPYYLLISVDKGAGQAMLEAGYLAEQMVLYLTLKSLGTCYQGGLRCLNPPPAPGMKQAVIIAFGYSRGKLLRSPDQAKRKKLSKLCQFREGIDDNMRTLLKAARMAPSAFNRQPWRFLAYADKIFVLEKRPLFGGKKPGSSLDMGIMLCHMELAAEELWMDISMKREETLADNKVKNCTYVITLIRAET